MSIFDGYTDKLKYMNSNRNKEENKMNTNNRFTLEIEAFAEKYGLEAPRVDKNTIDLVIGNVEYTVIGTLTICIVTAKNGFQFTGESACVDPKNYRKELGEELALKRAIEKLYVVEGYMLKELQYQNSLLDLKESRK